MIVHAQDYQAGRFIFIIPFFQYDKYVCFTFQFSSRAFVQGLVLLYPGLYLIKGATDINMHTN